jgi:hypothetical protein
MPLTTLSSPTWWPPSTSDEPRATRPRPPVGAVRQARAELWRHWVWCTSQHGGGACIPGAGQRGGLATVLRPAAPRSPPRLCRHPSCFAPQTPVNAVVGTRASVWVCCAMAMCVCWVRPRTGGALRSCRAALSWCRQAAVLRVGVPVILLQALPRVLGSCRVAFATGLDAHMLCCACMVCWAVHAGSHGFGGRRLGLAEVWRHHACVVSPPSCLALVWNAVHARRSCCASTVFSSRMCTLMCVGCPPRALHTRICTARAGVRMAVCVAAEACICHPNATLVGRAGCCRNAALHMSFVRARLVLRVVQWRGGLCVGACGRPVGAQAPL